MKLISFDYEINSQANACKLLPSNMWFTRMNATHIAKESFKPKYNKLWQM